MKKRVLLSSLLIWLGLVAFGVAQKRPDAAAELQSVVRAEREFARAAAEHGTRAAFLANLADDGIVFSPGPVNGKKSWSERPASPGLLSWEPVYADVARAGDLGYTTGPWEFRPQEVSDKPVAHGQYMTIWKKQPDGNWKFVLDVGTQNPAPVTERPALEFPLDFRKTTAQDKLNVDVAAERKSLLKVEREFSQAVAARGTAQAFKAYAADDLRLMRNGNFPALGRAAAVAALSAPSHYSGALTWQTDFADVSRSGELGYTYGAYELKSEAGAKAVERGSYVRIWKKREGKWRVVLDLLNPLPPAKN